MILTVLKMTISFVYQSSQKRKNGVEIIYRSKNTKPKNKIEIKLSIIR